MLFTKPAHGTERRYRFFAWFPVSVIRCHQRTGQTVWLGWVDVYESYVHDDGFSSWNGYSRVPAGEPVFMENCDSQGRYVGPQAVKEYRRGKSI